MVRLSREIRFALVPASHTSGQLLADSPHNSWAGWPSTNVVVPHLVLRCVLEGNPDPVTGFLCNIKVIDDLLRTAVTECLIPVYDCQQTAEEIIQIVFRRVSLDWQSKARIVSVNLELSPYLTYSIVSDDAMNPPSTTIQLTQQFEFSAAHRLQCDELSETENQTLFGKCNNPEGHGHNYLVEVTLANQLNSEHGQLIELDRFESTVKRLVIDRLDHKHLNRDIDYFSTINPTVENIAIAIFRWLDGQFGDVSLEKIRVYETPKTWAEYSGEP